MHKTLLLVFILLAMAQTGFGRTRVELAGQWVNVKDTTEHLTLLANGEFQMITHNSFSGEIKKLEGTWLYKANKKQKFFLFYNNRRKQFFVVRKRGALGYTLNDLKLKIVFARRPLNEGEELPKIESAIH